MWHFHTKYLWDDMPDVRLMLQFAAIAEERSFTRAAKRLGLAQPWLSARMRALEDELGSAVFERSSRGASLTPEGERLYEALRPVIASVAAFEAEFEEMRRRRSRRIRIGCPALSARDLNLVKLFDAFEAISPSTSLEVERGYARSLLYALRTGRCDFVFGATLSDDEVEAMPFSEHRIGVLMHRADPLALCGAISASDLAGRTLAAYSHLLKEEIDTYLDQMADFGVHVTRSRELHESMILECSPDDRPVLFAIVPTDYDFQAHGEVVLKPLEGSPRIIINLVRRRASRHHLQHEKFWALAQSLRLQG